jgi:hypothetical protein
MTLLNKIAKSTYEKSKAPTRLAFTAGALAAKYPEYLENGLGLSCAQDKLGSVIYNNLSPLEKVAVTADDALDYATSSEVITHAGDFAVPIAAGLWAATGLRFIRNKISNTYNITSERAKDVIDTALYGATAVGTTMATSISKVIDGDLIQRTLEGIATSIPDSFNGILGAVTEEAIFPNAFVATLTAKALYKGIKSFCNIGYKKK